MRTAQKISIIRLAVSLIIEIFNTDHINRINNQNMCVR
jgi:hypothetical protein